MAENNSNDYRPSGTSSNNNSSNTNSSNVNSSNFNSSGLNTGNNSNSADEHRIPISVNGRNLILNQDQFTQLLQTIAENKVPVEEEDSASTASTSSTRVNENEEQTQTNTTSEPMDVFAQIVTSHRIICEIYRNFIMEQ
jgi:hypothetical protein